MVIILRRLAVLVVVASTMEDPVRREQRGRDILAVQATELGTTVAVAAVLAV